MRVNDVKKVMKTVLPVAATVVGGIATVLASLSETQERREFKEDILREMDKNYVRKETEEEA